jgi:site-specific DNA-methyltransferase (adenine-specific)
MNEYTITRTEDFKKISNALGQDIIYQSKNATLISGDCLEILKQIPDKSISLILTDPPYHSTKKKNITNDTAFSTDDDFIDWIQELAAEWYRVLKPNGSIYLYCSSKMAGKIERTFNDLFNILGHIVWNKPNDPGFEGWKQKMKKESLRQWYGHSERIIFAEPAFEGNLFRVWFANFLREQRSICEISMKDLTEITGDYGKVNHGGAVSNWESGRNVPSREQYQKICTGLLATGKIDTMPPYEDLIRPFEVNSSIEFTDVWNFFSVRPYDGKHPAEKPLDMLEHCIRSSSYESDIVLDCFAGSGSTAIAALTNNRKSISIELDEKWVGAIKNRLD